MLPSLLNTSHDPLNMFYLSISRLFTLRFLCLKVILASPPNRMTIARYSPLPLDHSKWQILSLDQHKVKILYWNSCRWACIFQFLVGPLQTRRLPAWAPKASEFVMPGLPCHSRSRSSVPFRVLWLLSSQGSYCTYNIAGKIKITNIEKSGDQFRV